MKNTLDASKFSVSLFHFLVCLFLTGVKRGLQMRKGALAGPVKKSCSAEVTQGVIPAAAAAPVPLSARQHHRRGDISVHAVPSEAGGSPGA